MKVLQLPIPILKAIIISFLKIQINNPESMLMGSKNQGIKKLTIRIWVATHLVILPLLNFCHILKENYIGLPHKLRL
jgi:hypothetical protein